MRRINSAEKRALRERLCSAFDGRCAYCRTIVGLRRGTVDHYLPQALFGGNGFSNLRWSCERCNNLKDDMHPDEWERVKPEPVPDSETAAERRARILSHIAQLAMQARRQQQPECRPNGQA